MSRIIFAALLAGGILLLVLGINASNSFSSDVSRTFSGGPTDKAVWMLVGGAVATIAGLAGIVRGSRRA
jgi:hypothetical protein